MTEARTFPTVGADAVICTQSEIHSGVWSSHGVDSSSIQGYRVAYGPALTHCQPSLLLQTRSTIEGENACAHRLMAPPTDIVRGLLTASVSFFR